MAIVRDYTSILSGSYLGDRAIKTPVVVTYSFDTKPADYLKAAGYSDAAIKSWRAFNNADKTLALQAMSMMSKVSGIEFVQVEAGKGDIRFNKMNFDLTHSADAAGFAYYPGRVINDTYANGSENVGSDVFVNTLVDNELHLLMHEIGHAIGLKHTFEGDKVLATDLDNTGNTVMSYTGDWQGKLGYMDEQALQYVYGKADRPDGTLISYGYKDGILSQKWGSASSTITGSGSNDYIIGGAGNDKIAGFGGHDRLEGGSGADRIFGGGGDDIINPGSGNDTVYGGSQEFDSGEGIDTVDYSTFSTAIVVNLTMTYDWEANVWVDPSAKGSGIGTDTLFSIENVRGGGGADTIRGDANRNVILGNGGNDWIEGFGGNDELRGGAGMDTIYGSAGEDKLFGDTNRDQLFGGDDRDWLDGGTASDELTGGGGMDLFTFGDGYGKDKVLDFENDIDTIKLNDDLWSGTKTVSQVISQYCSIEGGNAVFDFGGGDILTVLDVSSLAIFKNDILIF